MKKPVQNITSPTQLLAAITLFCYSASVAALLVIGYSVITLAVNVAGQEISGLYLPNGM